MRPQDHELPAVPVEVGVVIVTYNSDAMIGDLLASLPAGLTGVRWDAVVVDNASSDRTVEHVRAAGFAVIRRPTNGGYAAAVNDGVRHFAGAESILVLNPDGALTAGAGAAMLAVVRADSRVGVVAPKTLLTLDPPVLDPTLRREPSLLRAWAGAIVGGRRSGALAWTSDAIADESEYERERDAEWVVGAALLIGRACIDAVGDWDESFFLYSEEVDFCRRARLARFTIRYTPRAVVHHVGGDGLENPRLRAMMVVNRVREYARHHHAVAAWGFYAGSLLHELTRAPRRPASRAAALALAVPRRRPIELGARQSLLPR